MASRCRSFGCARTLVCEIRSSRQYSAIAHLLLAQLSDRHIDLVESEALRPGLDSMARGNVEHLADLPGASDGASSDTLLAKQQDRGGQRNRLGGRPHEDKRAGGAK